MKALFHRRLLHLYRRQHLEPGGKHSGGSAGALHLENLPKCSSVACANQRWSRIMKWRFPNQTGAFPLLLRIRKGDRQYCFHLDPLSRTMTTGYPPRLSKLHLSGAQDVAVPPTPLWVAGPLPGEGRVFFFFQQQRALQVWNTPHIQAAEQVR